MNKFRILTRREPRAHEITHGEHIENRCRRPVSVLDERPAL